MEIRFTDKKWILASKIFWGLRRHMAEPESRAVNQADMAHLHGLTVHGGWEEGY